jgi:hypothetical protein
MKSALSAFEKEVLRFIGEMGACLLNTCKAVVDLEEPQFCNEVLPIIGDTTVPVHERMGRLQALFDERRRTKTQLKDNVVYLH